MKRIGSSPDSLVPIYSSGFRTMFGGMDEEEEELVNAVDEDAFSLGGGGGSSAQKKRRLSAEQVRALEKNFEVENKLEPERKARLAQELDLQPRQVAVWFQNRRARWKTKQLERDFGSLKSRYDALRLDYDSLRRDKESLLAEVKDLKAKLTGEDSGATVSESDTKPAAVAEEETLTLIYSKDGSSDSDSSAVLNDANSPIAGINGGGSGSGFGGSAGGGGLFYHQQLMKVESGFLDGEEPCSFFNDDQPPVLPWYCGDGWE